VQDHAGVLATSGLTGPAKDLCSQPSPQIQETSTSPHPKVTSLGQSRDSRRHPAHGFRLVLNNCVGLRCVKDTKEKQ
jgi:hypothetical protein